MENIQEYLNCIQTVPSLPSIVDRAVLVLNDPDSSSKSLSKIILSDVGISGRILKIVNSAYFGLPRRVSKITQATVMLGFTEVRNLVISTSIFSVFNGIDKLHRINLVRHSICCALGSQVIADHIKSRVSEDAFIAGLLHDIGKFVIAEYFPDKFNLINSLIKNKTICSLEAEDAVLGITHAKIGERLCEKWCFPSQTQEAVAYHHGFNNSLENKELVAIVHLADIMINIIGIPINCLPNIPIVPNYIKMLGLSIEELQEIFNKILVKIEDSFELLNQI